MLIPKENAAINRTKIEYQPPAKSLATRRSTPDSGNYHQVLHTLGDLFIPLDTRDIPQSWAPRHKESPSPPPLLYWDMKCCISPTLSCRNDPSRKQSRNQKYPRPSRIPNHVGIFPSGSRHNFFEWPCGCVVQNRGLRLLTTATP